MESRLRGSLIRILLQQPSESDAPLFSPCTLLQNLLFLSSLFTMATHAILLYVPENIIWLSEATVGR